MKKIILLVLIVVGVLVAKRKLDEGKREQALWSEATDPIERP